MNITLGYVRHGEQVPEAVLNNHRIKEVYRAHCHRLLFTAIANIMVK